VNFEPKALLAAYRGKFAASGLPENVQAALLEELTAGLEGYTYLED
jgi:arginine decarboxylase